MLYSFNNLKYIDPLNINIPENIKSILFNYCNSKFNQYLPKYDRNKAKILVNKIMMLFFIMSKQLNIQNTTTPLETFLKQISMNNDRNFIALVNLFLPYLDDKNNSYNQKNIRNLFDLVESTEEKTSDNKTKFCNYIYDHSNIVNMKQSGNTKYKDIKLLNLKIENKLPPRNEIKDFEIYYITVIFHFILDTFNRVRYKFYINWINTFPITLDTYKDTNLFKDSWNYYEDEDIIKYIYPLNFTQYNKNKNININKISDIVKENNNYIETIIEDSHTKLISYKGINLEDIYNTIVNDYYLSVKRNKWLLFEFAIDNKIKLIIQILQDLFNINTIVNEKSWNLLNDNEQNSFATNWKLYLEAVTKKHSFQNYKISILEDVLTSIVSYFELHYNGISKLKKDKLYQNLQENIDDDDDELLDIENGNIIFKLKEKDDIILTIDDYLNSINKAPVEDIYTFLYEEINAIKLTPYKFMIFEEDKLKILDFNKIDLNNTDNYELTPKNYYNYAKGVLFKSYGINSEYYDEENLLFPNLWDSLSIEEKYIITIRLNQLTIEQNWFNISSVLSKINYEAKNLKEYTQVIYKKIKSKLIELTFENLIRKGCICKFECHPEVSDSAILTNDYNTKSKRLAENIKKYVLTPDKIKEYKEGYYFANNTQYKNMDDLLIQYKNKEKRLNYIDYLSDMEVSGDKWFTFYAVDWVSQIDFYLKFINQRVMYITGATGQGKSTQVPKLYLYGLKSFSYKNNGKIFCTVPRIDPVLENARGISKSMGLPIENYDKDYDKNIPTLNGIVQHQYSSDSHININSNYFLRLMTDGTLLQILYGNQILKEQKITNSQNKLDPTIKMSNKNVCDVVMIDEAHEHNANMDIILTIMRHTLIYNNDIKLSIISATMEDDEPVFRKFYRFIDDNLTYPINLSNFSYGLDRNLIDRRYHISPPGMTTQHIVDEFYEDNSKDSYDNNEELAIKRVNTIFKSSPYGEILLFSTTEKKINKLVEILNKQIPSNCIALPYYGGLSEKYKKLSKNAKEEIIKITFHKDDVEDIFTGIKNEDETRKITAGTYTRCCIIATNAAEASLTITSLKYIVDIGYQLTVKYDYDILEVKVEEEKITEASRIQRRGRVGRVSNGTIYHMYPKGSRENIIPEYDISTSNFSDSFKALLTNDDSENNEIIDGNILYKLVTLQKLSNSEIIKIKKNPNRKLIYDQYKIDKEYYDKNNESKLIHNYDYKLYFDYLFPSYYSGFSSSILLDVCGHFYITNPLEGIAKRNIISSNFIDSSNNDKYITIKNINKIYHLAKINFEIIKFNNLLYKNNSVLEFNNINSKITNKDYDDTYVKLIALSFIIDESENDDLIKKILFLYRLLKTHINYDINELFTSDNKLNPQYFKDQEEININLNKFNDANKTHNSDLELFTDIFDNIIKYINWESINKNLNNNNQIISEDLNKFISNTNHNSKNLRKFSKLNNYDLETNNLINKLILKGDLTLEGINKDENNNLFKKQIKDEISENKTLVQYCKTNNLDFNKISNALIESLTEYIDLKSKFEDIKESIINLKQILNFPSPNDINEKIKLIFLFCHITNLYYTNNGKLYSLFNSNEIIPQYGTLKDLSTFGFYLHNNSDNKKLILSNLTKSDILNVAPYVVFNIENEGKKYLNYKDIENNMEFLFKKLNNFSYSKKEKKIIIDNINYEDINISNILMKRLISKPDLLDNQEGGFLLARKNPLMKLHIDSIKKLFNLKEIAEEENLQLDDFDFGYVAHSPGNDSVVSFYLCKIHQVFGNILHIHVLINDYNAIIPLVQRLRMRGIYAHITMHTDK
jgi:hypothetical protein